MVFSCGFEMSQISQLDGCPFALMLPFLQNAFTSKGETE